MKAKDLAKLLLKHPEVEVRLLIRGEPKVKGVIYEDDGLQEPRLFVVDSATYQLYDEDYEHGFKVTP